MNIQEHVESDNWVLFQGEVPALNERWLTYYSAEHRGEELERIYQMAIWTDWQWPITAIDFETKHHAKMTYFFEAGVFDLAERIKATEEWEPFDYPVMLGSWKYHEYRSVEHPYMMNLKRLEYRDTDSRTAADERIETSLLRVRDLIVKSSFFRSSHVEKEVWISISSPLDWHDHGTLYLTSDGSIVRTEAEQVVG